MLYFGNLKSFIMELFPTYPGALTIDWLSIVLIAIVVLCAISGIASGAAKSFWNNFGGILVALISFVVAAALCNMLAEMDFSASLKDPIHKFVEGLGGAEGEALMNSPHSRAEVTFFITNNGYQALSTKIPSFLSFTYPWIAAFILSCIPEIPGEATVADCLTNGITALIFAIIIFIIVSIILSIILGAIKKHIRKRHKVKKPGAISRLFGFLIGTVVGVVWAIVVVWIFSFLAGIPFFKEFLTNIWALDNDDVLTIGEYLYKTNYINMLISWITSFFA